MIQEIITYLVIGLSIAYTLFHTINLFLPNKGDQANPVGCNTCTACSAKKDILSSFKPISDK